MGVIDVHITFDNGKFIPSKDPVTLSKGRGESIEWHNDTGRDIKIAFDDTCPFHGPKHPYELKPGQHKHSGGIHCDPDTKWNYAISAAEGPVTDPQVIIEK